MLTCDYCGRAIEIETIKKIILRFITPEGKFIDRVYHLGCYCKSLEDKEYLNRIQSQICAEDL
jgi:hypothetical protein